MNTIEAPLTKDENAQLKLEIHDYTHRSYINATQLTDIAIDEYKKHNGRGLTRLCLRMVWQEQKGKHKLSLSTTLNEVHSLL